MTADEKKQQPSPDFLELWQRSAPPTTTGTKDAKDSVSRVQPESRYLWTNLSQMAPSDQAVLMSKLTGLWPYASERRAMNWPVHAGLLANCVTTSLIATKINADMVAMNSKMRFFDAVRTCPKSPFVFGIYSSGIAYYLLHQTMISPLIYREDEPCSSCLLMRHAAIATFTGIVMPMIATPYLCHYVLMQRQGEKFPEIKNMLEFLTLSFEGSRASRSLLPIVIPLQIAVAAASTYAALWGRKRVFGTMDADPDMAKELLMEVQSKPGVKEKVTDFLRKIPFLGGVVLQEAPENEKF